MSVIEYEVCEVTFHIEVIAKQHIEFINKDTVNLSLFTEFNSQSDELLETIIKICVLIQDKVIRFACEVVFVGRVN